MTPPKCSFRDPSGFVIDDGSQIFRKLTNSAGQATYSLLETAPIVKRLIEDQKLVSYQVAEQENDSITLSHPRVWFPSYPYEWSAHMLYEAGILTCQLSERLLSEGLGLKDATPYNVLFEGPRPLFVDIASIEKREPKDPLWLPFAQFQRMFLLPLWIQQFGVGLTEVFLTHADGISAEYCHKIAKKLDWMTLSLVRFPLWLAKLKKPSLYRKHHVRSAELAQFILCRLFKKCKKQLESLGKYTLRSKWSLYMTTLDHYSEKAFTQKEQWVKTWLTQCAPKTVLDVGCNTGHFSKLAAKQNARVVAIDYDSAVIDRLFQQVQEEQLDVLPLVVNLARPTPATGWNNGECSSFLKRAEGKFDLVLMLAVIHHMLVTERIPMAEIARLASGLTKQWIILEFVSQEDEKFIELTRGRDLYRHLTYSYFQDCFEKYFTFEQTCSIHPTRTLVLLKKHA